MLENDPETLALQLEAFDDYRVLRRLRPRPLLDRIDSPTASVGVVIDLETTGLNLRRDEIIELSMLRFWFEPTGAILGVDAAFQSFQEPSQEISAEVSALTGITQADVAGRKIDFEEVRAFVTPAAVIIAHNAAFDRAFAERASDVFVSKPWACSLSEVDWRSEGYEGRSLPLLALQAGFFYGGHRALEDCQATLELLSLPLPVSGRPGLAALLECARRPSWRIWAEQAPFEQKDVLRGRGYRWSTGDDGQPRAWWIEVPAFELDNELMFLQRDIYGFAADIRTRRMTAFDRYSLRL